MSQISMCANNYIIQRIELDNLLWYFLSSKVEFIVFKIKGMKSPFPFTFIIKSITGLRPVGQDASGSSFKVVTILLNFSAVNKRDLWGLFSRYSIKYNRSFIEKQDPALFIYRLFSGSFVKAFFREHHVYSCFVKFCSMDRAGME